jgi:hypothetical protein
MRIVLAFLLLVVAVVGGCDPSVFTSGAVSGTGTPGPGPSAVAQQLNTLSVSTG